jgi:ADP-ribose pyrophosphatase
MDGYGSKEPRNLSAAGVLLLDEKNKVLLQHRTDSDTWGIPGGGLNIGESLEDAARREVFEETNLTVGKMELFNVYSGEGQHWIYPDGNEVYIVNIVFVSRDFNGLIKADGIESKELKFFDVNDLPELIATNIPILSDLKNRIDKY